MSRVFEALRLIPSSARLAPLPLAGTENCVVVLCLCVDWAPPLGLEMRGRGGGVGRLGTLAGAGCRGMETSLPLLHYSEEPEQEQGFEAEERS